MSAEDYECARYLIPTDFGDSLLATQLAATADECPRASAGIEVGRWTSRLHLPQTTGRRAFRAVVAGPGHPRPAWAEGPLLRQAARNAALEF